MTAKEEHRREVFARDKHECRAAAIHVCSGRLTAEHVIPVVTLKSRARDLGVDCDRLIRDGRNGIILCAGANLNRRTTVRLERGDLPAHVFAFADDWSLMWYLDKHYPA